MDIHIHVKKGHLYVFLVGLSVVLGAFFVNAFGGSSPAVVGHSALELLVNGSSIADGNVTSAHILDGTITGTDIGSNTVNGTNVDESTLGTVPTATSADGAGYATFAGNANSCNADATCETNILSVSCGSSIVYKCGAAGGTLPVGTLTTDSTKCASPDDTDLRVC